MLYLFSKISLPFKVILRHYFSSIFLCESLTRKILFFSSGWHVSYFAAFFFIGALILVFSIHFSLKRKLQAINSPPPEFEMDYSPKSRAESTARSKKSFSIWWHNWVIRKPTNSRVTVIEGSNIECEISSESRV